MKKLTLLLSTLTLILCFAFSVNAAGENVQTAVNINLNQSLNIEFVDDVYEYYLKFTPTKTGWYEINLDNFVADETYITTYDSIGEEIGFEGWNEFKNKCFDVLELKANKTYYFEIHCFEDAIIYATIRNHSHNYKVDYISEASEGYEGSISKVCAECETTTETAIPKLNISLSKKSFTYNGTTQKPTVVVKDSTGKTFKEGTDYKVTYPKSINADSYSLNVYMKNTYYDVDSTLYYSITAKSINGYKAKLKKSTVSYGQHPTVLISGLKDGKDFYCDSYYFGVGKYTAKVYGTGNYTGETTVTFKVTPTKISGFKASKATTNSIKLTWNPDPNYSTEYYQIYDVAKGKVVATVDSYTTSYTIKKLKPGKKYSFKVRGYTKKSGEKYYGEWKTIEASTLPKSTTLSSVKSEKKKALTVKWKKQSAATGYQVQYSTNSKFKKSATKTVTVKKNKQTSSKISKLKSGKKYYVKVRTYKTLKINGKSTKVYSAWSSVKSAKVK